MNKKVIAVTVLLFLGLVSLAAVIVPPFVIVVTEISEAERQTNVIPMDQVNYQHHDETQTVCVNASCGGLEECESAFTSFKYNDEPELKTITYRDSYLEPYLGPGNYFYDCRAVGPMAQVLYEYTVVPSRDVYLFTYDEYVKFEKSHATTGANRCEQDSCSWMNKYQATIQTKCLVIDNTDGSSLVSVALTASVKNEWYDVSNITAVSSCVGSFCCFDNTERNQYIIVNHNYHQSSPTNGTVIFGVPHENRFGTAVIVHVCVGSFAFLFFMIASANIAWAIYTGKW